MKHPTDTQAEYASKIPPFTITVTEPDDALFIAEAILLRISGGSMTWVQLTLDMIGVLIPTYGVSKTVDEIIKAGEQYGFTFPKFTKPVLIHVITSMNPKVKP